MPRKLQPFTFEYDLTSGSFEVESRLAKTHPHLFKSMPFNYVLVEAERECSFYLNQDKNKLLHVPVGGGVVESNNINLWSWKLKNEYAGNNKVYVTVERT